MTEDEARAWVAEHFGETMTERLGQFGEMVVAENERQNLIAPATVDQIWTRHLLDSAQLLRFASERTDWLDIGTGAGFPGMVIALLSDVPVTMVEPRARRADFLKAAAARLGLDHAIVFRGRAEALPPRPYDMISARAVAPLAELLTITGHLRGPRTRLVLPRGRGGAADVDLARAHWQGMFHVEHSVTDPESLIVIADGVSA
ncbi:16S rRNA (guanine(527)-N(7))-methyltransferase RsmG [Sphingomonas yunnanensis]|uniref:16S rRNA (guanine(527)-N(7))-methyltransferase RsmG n=1 Tax=Sphingomonas yunnanensis TaxID=310400 RepID=UPI001CA6083A|nr:16S rRNA (guanine(527)-N(7))-methyltransferase RsmG [Sphingomonas yunnanensis]MBY9065006.1 16S rRNA (guanine(527)-N(7))-methyltransferase RsmG [Sphingomonas yunnanensis]